MKCLPDCADSQPSDTGRSGQVVMRDNDIPLSAENFREDLETIAAA